MTTAFERAMNGAMDPSWYTGRGAFGGVVAAKMLRAMEAKVADAERVPRSLTVHFCGPATEDASVPEAEVVRVGSRISHATARIRRGDEIATIASASFCKPRPAVRYATDAMPVVAPPSELRDFPRDVPGVPAFFQHFEVRFCGDTMPFSGAKTPAVAAWVRLREAVTIDAAVAAAYLDSLPPAITALFPSPRPVATVDFTIHYFERLPERAGAADAFHLVAIRSRWADEGYTEELRDLWSPDGVLLGQCRQVLALL